MGKLLSELVMIKSNIKLYVNLYSPQWAAQNSKSQKQQ